MHNGWSIFLWVIYSYIMLALFFIGTSVRFKYFHPSITAKSGELFEKKWLMVGSATFHTEVILAFFGHCLGMSILASWTAYFGITDHVYHIFGSLMIGIPAGILAFVGIAILTYRRMTCSRVYKTGDINDITVDWALLVTIALGLAYTITGTFIDYNYRTIISPWVGSLFVSNPQWQLMRPTPLIYKIHVLRGLATSGYFPYTRLVHILTLPWQYIFRRFIVYRRRARVY